MLDIDSNVMLYNAIVKPYFIYYNIIYATPQEFGEMIIKILRVMAFSEYNYHTGPLFYLFLLTEK